MSPRNAATIALRGLERLLPGHPVAGSDPRWQAMLAIQDRFIVSHPEEIWGFVLRWSKHPRTDLRDAVACCLLEHLLENHFQLLFPRVFSDLLCYLRLLLFQIFCSGNQHHARFQYRCTDFPKSRGDHAALSS